MSGKKYPVSVVTPFHNVDLKMFQGAYESIKAQTIGFENVQWIVVVHNSDKEYLDAVKEMLQGNDNILIKELNNEAHTPSSPRNYGMNFIEGEYLAFLDGDDSFTPYALETTVNKAKQHSADVVVFRREYELEKEGLQTVTEITLWNQTLEEVVMDRAHWDTEKMFSGIWGMVTSRLFNASFLKEHNIRFDEEIPFAEDMDFVISAYTFADTVVYLPQTIGYHYLINGGSLMQSMDKPGKTLVGYAKGFAKIFQKMLDMGVYADSSVNGLCMLLAQYMVSSSSITTEDKETIKDVLEEYLNATEMSIVNKTCSKEESEITYSFPREVILNPTAQISSYSMKRKRDGIDTLNRILDENLETDFGQRYQFSIIQTAAGYQARVPIMDMKKYKTLCDLRMKIGESGILTFKSAPLFLSEISATGEKRYSIATKEYLEKLGNLFLEEIVGKKNAVFYGARFPAPVYNSYVSDVAGVMLTYYNALKYSTLNNGTEIVIPDLLLFQLEETDGMYYQTLFAISNPDVEQIIASSCWQLYEMIDCIRSNWEMMVHDLDQGIVTGPGLRSAKFEKALNAALVKDPERAASLREIFREGIDKNTIRKIWPKLSKVIAPGDGSYRIYKDLVRDMFEGVSLSNGTLIFPEAVIGRPTEQDDVYELCKEDIFYEFIPFEESNHTQKRPLLVSDVVPGKKYILVLTSTSGLYRYNSEIIVRIEKNEFDSLQFSFCGYASDQFMDEDFIFEKDRIYSYIRKANEEAHARITDYAYCIEDKVLKLFYETAENAGIRSADFTDILKATIKEPYLKDIVTYKMDNGSQLLYRALVKYKNKITDDRINPIRLITTKAQRMFFESCVCEEGDY